LKNNIGPLPCLGEIEVDFLWGYNIIEVVFHLVSAKHTSISTSKFSFRNVYASPHKGGFATPLITIFVKPDLLYKAVLILF
jgi:hypothetical protein